MDWFKGKLQEAIVNAHKKGSTATCQVTPKFLQLRNILEKVYATKKRIWFSFEQKVSTVLLKDYYTLSGWWFQPLLKIWKSVGMIILNIWKIIRNGPNHQPVINIYIWSFGPFRFPGGTKGGTLVRLARQLTWSGSSAWGMRCIRSSLQWWVFTWFNHRLPSGKLTICNWKWPFIVSFPWKMVIFHSYVSLPEGNMF